jgi:hypothetical protein
MATGVVEGAQLTVEPADDDDRAPRDIGDEQLPRASELGGGPDCHPAGREDPLALEGEEIVGGVGLRSNRLGERYRSPRPGVGLLLSEMLFTT